MPNPENTPTQIGAALSAFVAAALAIASYLKSSKESRRRAEEEEGLISEDATVSEGRFMRLTRRVARIAKRVAALEREAGIEGQRSNRRKEE